MFLSRLRHVSYFIIFESQYFILSSSEAPMMLVLEYAPYGDLLGYLRKTRGVEDKYYSSSECCQQEVTSYDMLSFAQQIASGMSFLASKKVRIIIYPRAKQKRVIRGLQVAGSARESSRQDRVRVSDQRSAHTLITLPSRSRLAQFLPRMERYACSIYFTPHRRFIIPCRSTVEIWNWKLLLKRVRMRNII